MPTETRLMILGEATFWRVAAIAPAVCGDGTNVRAVYGVCIQQGEY